MTYWETIQLEQPPPSIQLFNLKSLEKASEIFVIKGLDLVSILLYIRMQFPSKDAYL